MRRWSRAWRTARCAPSSARNSPWPTHPRRTRRCWSRGRWGRLSWCRSSARVGVREELVVDDELGHETLQPFLLEQHDDLVRLVAHHGPLAVLLVRDAALQRERQVADFRFVLLDSAGVAVVAVAAGRFKRLAEV